MEVIYKGKSLRSLPIHTNNAVCLDQILADSFANGCKTLFYALPRQAHLHQKLLPKWTQCNHWGEREIEFELTYKRTR